LKRYLGARYESVGQLMDEKNYADLLRSALINAVKRCGRVTHALTSGGLDSSIAVLLMRLYGAGRDFKGVAVCLEGQESPDIRYAELLAERLGIELLRVRVNVDEALKAVEEVVKALASFDPMEVVNSSAILVALKAVKDDGGIGVLTGDGGDELFAGYSYMHGMGYGELEEYIKHLVKTWRFSSIELGKYLGLKIYSPYLDEEVVDLALKIPTELKLKRGRETIGKYILRVAFQDLLPPEIVWRDKHPIELGSGFNALYKILEELSDGRAHEGVRFWHRAQPYLYEVFSKFHRVRPPAQGEKQCPYCGSGVPKDKRYCRTCGAYPV